MPALRAIASAAAAPTWDAAHERKSSSTGAVRPRRRSAATAAPTAGTRRISSSQRNRTPDSRGRAYGGIRSPLAQPAPERAGGEDRVGTEICLVRAVGAPGPPAELLVGLE